MLLFASFCFFMYDKLWGSLMLAVLGSASPCSLHVSHVLCPILYRSFLWRSLLHQAPLDSYLVHYQAHSLVSVLLYLGKAPLAL
jgi:hypothetical protein